MDYLFLLELFDIAWNAIPSMKDQKTVMGNHAANKRAVKLTRELWGKLLFVILLLLIDIFGDNVYSFLHSKIPNRDVNRVSVVVVDYMLIIDITICIKEGFLNEPYLLSITKGSHK